ncbi:hypothetical protein CFHF_21430 [Caulobacter flavus]|uniref:ATP-binding protein n=1 Tax=Caulobacter flavus TaxID=1679497 RepID=A0A2N5CMY6_9CAUL|nr:hypothetical protein [Caulobacter flavus]AYV46561.1 hypothetical protein C1707_09955 [Caulobacter flavus]PLR07797.1 hypothetical protein CFHF_21430 [Caulobacter flavus]
MTEFLFRSLNLTEDLRFPLRFGHYRPTRRATPIISAVMAPQGAHMVIAPYGSGKTLAAGVGALAVRHDPTAASLVGGLAPALDLIDPELGRRINNRLRSTKRGEAVVLTGYEQEPLQAIARALGIKKLDSLDGLAKALKDKPFDHVAIIWDEFGRHLEGLTADGRTGELDFVQRLAERASRASGPTLSLTLLLHQNMLAYASRLNETTRTEWRKIEGRFETIRLIEDSQEIYKLVGEVVTTLRPEKFKPKAVSGLAQRIKDARWFDAMEDEAAIEALITQMQPLTAGALQILPRLVARVGQNERSLFSFLREAEMGRPVGIEEVYQAFADAMRSDVGIGGSYRRWVEAESARSRARDDLQRELIAAACLLQLGVSGERLRLPREALELSVLSERREAADITRAVDDLLSANLLLWRRHNDDVAVWHGADIDVAMRVREERDRLASSFDLLAFLNARFPAPNVRTPGHNARAGVNRYFRGAYARAADVIAPPSVGQAASIVYVLARSKTEIDAAREAAHGCRAERLIRVIPRRVLDIESAALELVALEALRTDKAFIASDPMVTTELQELESVAFEQLAMLLRPLLTPRGPAADWFAQGQQLVVTNDRPGTMAASKLFDDWYGETPRIDNEQLMRDQPSRMMQTSRVRIITKILQRADRERLGLEENETSAEASIYRTVFERTGLHQDTGFVGPNEIADTGLRSAWSKIADFMRSPTQSPRPLGDLLHDLQKTPIGLPLGVAPLLIAAGYQKFARNVALYRDGVYEPDLLGFKFDQMVMYPAGFTVQVLPNDAQRDLYLREICDVFAHEQPNQEDELVRCAYDAIQRWLTEVPESARRVDRLGADAKALLRLLSSATDPVALLLEDIPALFSTNAFDPTLIVKLEAARKAVDGLEELFAHDAVAVITETFRAATSPQADLIEVVRAWSDCFDLADLEQRQDLKISDRAVLAKTVETANGRFSARSLATALSLILLKTGLEKWDDPSPAQFRTALREARERIETAAISTETPQARVRPILEARIGELKRQLAQLDAQSHDTPQRSNIREVG